MKTQGDFINNKRKTHMKWFYDELRGLLSLGGAGERQTWKAGFF